MELSKTARAVFEQAQQLRVRSNKKDVLCTEHILYGLLYFADDCRKNTHEENFSQEGQRAYAELKTHFKSPESVLARLDALASDPQGEFSDGRVVVGRAAELADSAGKGQIDAACIGTALFENETPLMRSLSEFVLPKFAAASEPEPEHTNDSDKKQDGLTPSQFGAMLALLAALQESQHSEPQPHRPGVRRKTKIGLFTYRGGPVAAAIQYFLFGILIPVAALFALELTTGAVMAPPSPFIAFLLNAFLTVWLYYVARGVIILLGLASIPLSHFLCILEDSALTYFLAAAAVSAWSLPTTPTWMKVVVSLLWLIILLIGGSLFQYLKDQGEPTKTKILFQNVEGTPWMIFFRHVTKALILPMLAFAVFWIFRLRVPFWLDKTFWIWGFFWAWDILSTLWRCISLRYKASTRCRGSGKFAYFMVALHLFWGLPVFTVYLHWLFSWFPMKTWVIVILGIWGVFTLLLAALSTRSDTGIL